MLSPTSRSCPPGRATKFATCPMSFPMKASKRRRRCTHCNRCDYCTKKTLGAAQKERVAGQGFMQLVRQRLGCGLACGQMDKALVPLRPESCQDQCVRAAAAALLAAYTTFSTDGLPVQRWKIAETEGTPCLSCHSFSCLERSYGLMDKASESSGRVSRGCGGGYAFVQEVQRSRAMAARQTSVFSRTKARIENQHKRHHTPRGNALANQETFRRPFLIHCAFLPKTMRWCRPRVLNLETHKNCRVHSSVVKVADCRSAGP